MEVLLNLAWLLLALPAFLLWRQSKRAPGVRQSDSLHRLLSLACLLVLLFPVVSATDDLRSMRADIEESPAGKSGVRRAASDRGLSSKIHVAPALAEIGAVIVGRCEQWRVQQVFQIYTPKAATITRTGRAPPHSSLG